MDPFNPFFNTFPLEPRHLGPLRMFLQLMGERDEGIVQAILHSVAHGAIAFTNVHEAIEHIIAQLTPDLLPLFSVQIISRTLLAGFLSGIGMPLTVPMSWPTVRMDFVRFLSSIPRQPRRGNGRRPGPGGSNPLVEE